MRLSDPPRLGSALLAAIALAAVPLALAGCEQDGPAESAGESIDQAVDDAGEALEEATEDLDDAG